MDDEKRTLIIKVTNHLTGEITEQEVKGADAAEQLYLQLKASQKATETAMKQLLSFLDEWLGVDDKQVFADGHRIERIQRETRRWTPEALRRVGLDSDAIEVVMTVNMTAAKELVQEAIERGEIAPTAKKELDAAAEVSVTKPYVQIK